MRLLRGGLALLLGGLVGRLGFGPDGLSLVARLNSILVGTIKLCPPITRSAIVFDGPLLGDGCPILGCQLGTQRCIKLLREFGRPLLLGLMPCGKFPDLLMRGLQFRRLSLVGTVSYTHLDVYKRQPLLAGASSLDSGIEGKKIGLVGDLPDHICLLYTSRCV